MSATKLHHTWLFQLALILFSALIIFFHLIPFSLTPTPLPTPDILFCVISALIIRRPEIVPFWIVGLIYFGFDVFLMRPLGVWTMCILGAAMVLRSNRDAFRENPFLFEWLYTSLIFLLALMAQQTLLAVSFVPTPPALSMVWEFVFTAAAYPIILFVITYILRIKKPALGALGYKG